MALQTIAEMGGSTPSSGISYGEAALWRVSRFKNSELIKDFQAKYPHADKGSILFESATLASIYEKVVDSMSSTFHHFPSGWIDYGCGNGHISLALFEQFGDSSLPLHLIDKNPKVIDQQITKRRNVKIERYDTLSQNSEGFPMVAGVLSIINPVDIAQIREAFSYFGKSILENGATILHIADTDLRGEFISHMSSIPELSLFSQPFYDFLEGQSPVCILHKKQPYKNATPLRR